MNTHQHLSASHNRLFPLIARPSNTNQKQLKHTARSLDDSWRNICHLTSDIKISKSLVATGSGKLVRKIVRNQDDAYIEV